MLTTSYQLECSNGWGLEIVSRVYAFHIYPPLHEVAHYSELVIDDRDKYRTHRRSLYKSN